MSGASVASARSERSQRSSASLRSSSSKASSASNISKASKATHQSASSNRRNASGSSVVSQQSRQSLQSLFSHQSQKSHSSSASASLQSIQSGSSASASSQSHRSVASGSVASRSSASTRSTTSSSVASSSSRSSRASSSSTNSSSMSYRSNSTSKTSATSLTSSTARTVRSTRGEKALSLKDEGIEHLDNQEYSHAVLSFTKALSSYPKHEGRNPPEGGTEERIERTLATLYGYRCQALFEVGELGDGRSAYEGAIRDARSALECERIAGCKRSIMSAVLDAHPYSNSANNINSSSHSSPNNANLLHPEKGPVLRSKVLNLLGYSLLRMGTIDGVSEAFEGSLDVAQKAIEDSEEFTEGERNNSPTHNDAMALLQRTIIPQANEGTALLERYKGLKAKLEHDYRQKDYMDNLNKALELAKGCVSWKKEVIVYLIGRRRWFEVANFCEQLAAKTLGAIGQNDGIKTIYIEDLADLDYGAPPVEELSSDFFAEKFRSSKGLPPYLRTLNTKAVCDAVFLLPKDILPYYLRSLRLEERYGAAVRAGTALSQFHDSGKNSRTSKRGPERRDDATVRKALHDEWDKLERTIKLKEEGDALFRDGYFERAAEMYGECLAVDGEGLDGKLAAKESAGGNGKAIRRLDSNGSVSSVEASKSASKSGGRLHAVLHSNRAACFSALGQYQDAVTESSHAIEIHSMYMKAILRRARCYVKIGDIEKARTDFNRWVILTEGAIRIPYPPQYQGPACYFDMPSEVPPHEMDLVKQEMNELGIRPSVGGGNGRGYGGVLSLLESLKCPCFKKKQNRNNNNSTNGESHQGSLGGLTTISMREDNDGRGSTRTQTKGNQAGTTSVRSVGVKPKVPPPNAFAKDPPTGNPALIRSRPAFEHPLDPPTILNVDSDYYALLDLDSTASSSEIKQAYHKLARIYHPDRNNSEKAKSRFAELNAAYDVLGNSEKKREYDRCRTKILEP